MLSERPAQNGLAEMIFLFIFQYLFFVNFCCSAYLFELIPNSSTYSFNINKCVTTTKCRIDDRTLKKLFIPIRLLCSFIPFLPHIMRTDNRTANQISTMPQGDNCHMDKISAIPESNNLDECYCCTFCAQENNEWIDGTVALGKK